jgi:hypothetical protein
MPEVNEIPAVNQIIEEKSTEENPVMIGLGVFDRIRNAATPQEGSLIIHQFVDQMIASVPEDIRDETIELVNQVVPQMFGPFWGEPVYREGGGIPRVIESARLQQQLVHMIYAGSLEGTHDGYSETIYNMVKCFETAATVTENDPRNRESWGQFGNWWNGVKAELAVVKLFKSGDYPEKVIVPDYTGGGNQVRLWDVQGKVDLVVLLDALRTSLAVDVKSVHPSQRRPIAFHPVLNRQLLTLDRSLQATLLGDGGYRVLHGEIPIPAGTVSGLADAQGASNKRQALANFGHLQPQDERFILTAIDRSIQRR